MKKLFIAEVDEAFCKVIVDFMYNRTEPAFTYIAEMDELNEPIFSEFLENLYGEVESENYRDMSEPWPTPEMVENRNKRIAMKAKLN